jgi:hypothetical protein
MFRKTTSVCLGLFNISYLATQPRLVQYSTVRSSVPECANHQKKHKCSACNQMGRRNKARREGHDSIKVKIIDFG